MASSQELVNAIMASVNQGRCCCDKQGWRPALGMRLKRRIAQTAALAVITTVLSSSAAREKVMDAADTLFRILGKLAYPVFNYIKDKYPKLKKVVDEVLAEKAQERQNKGGDEQSHILTSAQIAAPVEDLESPLAEVSDRLHLSESLTDKLYNVQQEAKEIEQMTFQPVNGEPKYLMDSVLTDEEKRQIVARLDQQIAELTSAKERFESIGVFPDNLSVKESYCIKLDDTRVPDLREDCHIYRSNDNEVVNSDDLFAAPNTIPRPTVSEGNILESAEISLKSDSEIQIAKGLRTRIMHQLAKVEKTLGSVKGWSQETFDKVTKPVQESLKNVGDYSKTKARRIQASGKQVMTAARVPLVKSKEAAAKMLRLAKDADVVIPNNEQPLGQLPTIDLQTGVRPLNTENPLAQDPCIVDVCKNEDERKKLASLLMEWEVQSQTLTYKCNHLLEDFRAWVRSREHDSWLNPEPLLNILDRVKFFWQHVSSTFSLVTNQPQVLLIYLKLVRKKMVITSSRLLKTFLKIPVKYMSKLYHTIIIWNIRMLTGLLRCLRDSHILEKTLKIIIKHPWISISLASITKYLILPQIYAQSLKHIFRRKMLTTALMRLPVFKKYVVEQLLSQLLTSTSELLLKNVM